MRHHNERMENSAFKKHLNLRLVQAVGFSLILLAVLCLMTPHAQAHGGGPTPPGPNPPVGSNPQPPCPTPPPGTCSTCQQPIVPMSPSGGNGIAQPGSQTPHLVTAPTNIGGTGGTAQPPIVVAAPTNVSPVAIPPIVSAPRTAGGVAAPQGTSPYPVKYFNGQVIISPQDIVSPMGDGFGYTRCYNNQTESDYDGPNGFDWFPVQMPWISIDASNSSNYEVQLTTSNGIWFTDSSGTFSPMFPASGAITTLTADTTNHQLVFVETTGGSTVTYRFWDYTQTTYPQGALASCTDSFGTTTDVTSYTSGTNAKIEELQRSYTQGGITTIYSLLFSYEPSGENEFRLDRVTLRSSTSASPGSWTIIRQASYLYYQSSDTAGSLNDLKTAVIGDGASPPNTIDTYYYRYYTSSSSIGFVHGLEYVVNPQSYSRMSAAYTFTDPNSLSDTEVATYADNYFQYDSSRRVSEEIAQGAGCSCGGGSGQGTLTQIHTTNTNSGYSNGFNTWKYKTVETYADGTTHTEYSNYAGQTMLSLVTDSSTQWATFYLYDSYGNLHWKAMPSAVLPPGGMDTYDVHNDLLDSVSGSYTYLSNSSGVIYVNDFATSTTATSSTPGNVAGFAEDTQVQQGQAGTPIMITSQLYRLHSADLTTAGDGLGGTVYPVDSTTEYNSTGGTGAEKTSYSYTWASASGLATNYMTSVTTTKPLISTAQNGPGGTANDVSVVFFDSFGRPQWSKDADGFINYTAYDSATGAPVETIVDVNTSTTSDFTNLPSGWTTPSGGGLNLTTAMAVDGLGRMTSLTDPNGNTTYTVYLDLQHEIRVYPGWQSGSSQTTGPVQVSREDRSSVTTYDETLTMAPSTISTSSGVPTGGESISNIQALSRNYLDNSGRVANSDRYFYWGTLTYSNTTSLGAQNTNFYRASFGYDLMGRRERIVDPVGTIMRTVYDGADRVTSTWMGTNDSTTDGNDWSPTDNSSPANMIEITSSQYDGGGVGDSLLTQRTTYADSNSSDNRNTLNWYDWRDRLVATKSGVILSSGSESLSTENDGTHRPLICATLDNLGRTTELDRYDGDFVAASNSSGSLSLSSGYAGYLRSKAVTNYDDQDRPYELLVYSVDQSAGTVSSTTLTTNTYFNHRGLVIETSAPGGLVRKYVFDGAGRITTQYTTDGGSGTGWSNASVVSGDNILEETLTTIDSDGNVILATEKQHFHDDTNTGELGNPATTPKARTSYVATYFDAVNRVTATVNVGTNNGSGYSRLSSVPTRSTTVLVNSYTYMGAGWSDTSTDPKGIITARYYDMLGA